MTYRMRQQFTSKQQGMNTRKHRWSCHDCENEWTTKTKKCPHCGGKDFAYFPSALEFKRFVQLRLLWRHGAITNLKLQPAFPVEINGQKICTYKADFQYIEKGVTVIEDCKGLETGVFVLKKKLVEAIYDINIRILKKV